MAALLAGGPGAQHGTWQLYFLSGAGEARGAQHDAWLLHFLLRALVLRQVPSMEGNNINGAGRRGSFWLKERECFWSNAALYLPCHCSVTDSAAETVPGGEVRQTGPGSKRGPHLARRRKNKKEEIFSISKFDAFIDALAAAGSSSSSSRRSSNSSCHLPNNSAHYNPAEATV